MTKFSLFKIYVFLSAVCVLFSAKQKFYKFKFTDTRFTAGL